MWYIASITRYNASIDIQRHYGHIITRGIRNHTPREQSRAVLASTYSISGHAISYEIFICSIQNRSRHEIRQYLVCYTTQTHYNKRICVIFHYLIYKCNIYNSNYPRVNSSQVESSSHFIHSFERRTAWAETSLEIPSYTRLESKSRRSTRLNPARMNSFNVIAMNEKMQYQINMIWYRIIFI